MDQPQKTEPVSRPRRRRRYVWLLLLPAMLAAAPSLIGWTGQLETITARCLPEIGPLLHCESADLHWWSPVCLRNVVIDDPDSSPESRQALLQVETLRTKEPLWRILVNRGQAHIRLTNPVARIHRRPDGATNVHTVLEMLSGGEGGSASGVAVTVENGTVFVETPASNGMRVTRLCGIAAEFAPAATGRGWPTMKCVGSLGEPGAETVSAQRQREVRIAAAESPGTPDTGFRRSSYGDIAAEHSGESAHSFQTPSVSNDGAAAAGLPAAFRIILQPAEDGGKAAAVVEVKEMPLQALDPLITSAIPGLATNGLISLSFRGSLADSGSASGFAGNLRAECTQLSCRHSGWAPDEKLSTDRLTADASLSLSAQGIDVRSLNVDSDIVSLSGRGSIRVSGDSLNSQALSGLAQHEQNSTASEDGASAERVEISGVMNVPAVAGMLPETLGLHRDLRFLDGAVNVGLRIVRDTGSGGAASAPVVWQLAARPTDIRARHSTGLHQIPDDIRLDGSGYLTGLRPELRAVRLSGDFGTLVASPMSDAYHCQGQVDPVRIHDLIQGFVPMREPGIVGMLSVDVTCGVVPGGIRLRNSVVRSDNLEVATEEAVFLPGESLDRCILGRLSIRGDTAALRTLAAPVADFSWVTERGRLTAELTSGVRDGWHFKARLRPYGAVTGATLPPGQNPSRHETGYPGRERPSSDAAFHPAVIPGRGRSPSVIRGISAAAGSSRNTTRTVGASEAVSWQLSSGDIEFRLVPGEEADEYVVQTGRVSLPGITADVNGTVRELRTDPILRMTADVSCDMSQVSRDMTAVFGTPVRMSGQWTERFELDGRLKTVSDRSRSSDSMALRVTGAVGWDSAEAIGLRFGPARVNIAVQDSVLRTEPVRCRVNGGELALMAEWSLAENLISAAPGSGFRNVLLDDQSCRELLSWVAPILADSANASGRFSLRLDEADLRPTSMASSRVSGTLAIHEARASAGSSTAPLLQLLELAGRGQRYSDRALVFPEQTTRILLENGRLHHEMLSMELNQYMIRSSGAVGLDQRLAISLEVPLEKSSAGRRGRSVRVPLEGSVRSPRIDVAAAIQEFGRSRVEHRLNDEVDRGLQKLLDRL